MKGRQPVRTLLVLILLLGSFLNGRPALAGGMAADLARKVAADPNSTESVRVIVRQRGNGVSLTSLSTFYNGRLLRGLPLVGGLLVSLPLKQVSRLADDAGVAWISPDRVIAREWDYDVETTGADQVWANAGVKGSGIRVAVLDTGVTSNTADWNRWGTTTSRIAAWNDLVNGGLTPYDDNGHGTHVAGILLGSGNASGGRVTGTAPDADLVAVKVLDQNGEGTVSTVLQGINWCVANRALLGIRIINLSLGHAPAESAETDPLCQAIRQAVNAGIVVICSAGNRGKNSNGQTQYGGISSPGIEPSAITVGALNTGFTATRTDDTVTTYSSRGPTYPDYAAKPDLLAAGNWIISVRAPGSALDVQHPEVRVDPDPSTSGSVDYFQLSGTSMAAPQVAGTVALMLQANSSLDPNTIKGALMFTAQRLALKDAAGTPLPDGLSLLTQGAGSLNSLGAVTLAAMINPGASTGQPWLTGTLSPQSSLPGGVVAWSTQVNWGGATYSGSDLFALRQEAWSSGVVWNSTAAWAGQMTGSPDGVLATEGTWQQHAVWNNGWDSGLSGDQATWGDGPANAFDGTSPMDPLLSGGGGTPPPPPPFEPDTGPPGV